MPTHEIFYVVFTALFGNYKAALFSRVLAALAVMCPCAPTDAVCADTHLEVAAVIAEVSESDEDAARLIATGAHETRFKTKQQVLGVAVSFWQLEVPKHEREFYLNNTRAAAFRARDIARSGMGVYACGDPKRCPQVAEDLRSYEARARWLLQ